MKRRWSFILSACLTAGALISGCGRSCNSEKKDLPTDKAHHVSPSPTLVTIDGKPCISESEFLLELSKHGGHVPGRYQSLESKKELLDELVRFELLAREAEKAGFGDAIEVERARKNKMVELHLASAQRRDLGPAEVSDDEVQAYYEAHKDDYEKPPLRRASVIVIKKTPGKEEESRARAIALLAQIKEDPSSRNFRTLTIKESDDLETRSRGGDLGWLTQSEPSDRVDDAVEAAVWSLKKNEVSELIESGDSFYIVLVTGVKVFRSRSFDLVKDSIRYELEQEKQKNKYNEYIDSLSEDVKVEIDEERLNAIVAPGDRRGKGGPPAFPVGP